MPVNTISDHKQITNIVNTNESLYFQIQLWNNVKTKILNFNINLLLRSIIKIDSKSYGSNSIICGHSPSMNETHYMSLTLHQSKWLRAQWHFNTF